MPPRILSPAGVTHIGWSKDTIVAVYGAEGEHRTTFRMPHALAAEARDLRTEFRCSENDVYLVALAEWMDELVARRPNAVGERAGPEPDDRVRMLDLLRTPRAWTVADKDAFADFRKRAVKALALVLVAREGMRDLIASLVEDLPFALKEEAVLAGAMLDEPAVLKMLRPRFRADRRFVIDAVHYAFGRDGETLALLRREPNDNPPIFLR